MVHRLLAGMLVPHAGLPPVVATKSPLATRLLMGTAAAVLLVSVTTCAELELPTATVPNESEVGETLTARMPVPIAFCTSVIVEALSLKVMPPTSDPAIVGVTVTVTVQDLPAASE